MHRSALLPVEDRCTCGEDARNQTDPCADFIRLELPRRRTLGTKPVRRIGGQEGKGQRDSLQAASRAEAL